MKSFDWYLCRYEINLGFKVLLATLFFTLGLFVPLGFSVSSPPRLALAIFTPSLLVIAYSFFSQFLYFLERRRSIEYKDISKYQGRFLGGFFALSAILVGQWLIFGCVHTSEGIVKFDKFDSRRDYGNVGVSPFTTIMAGKYWLEEGDGVSLPLFGAYAYFDGRSIKARRNFWSKEISFSCPDDPKALGISLFGGRLAVRTHHRGWGGPFGNPSGRRTFFSLKTGKILNQSSLENDFWHTPLYLIW